MSKGVEQGLEGVGARPFFVGADGLAQRSFQTRRWSSRICVAALRLVQRELVAVPLELVAAVLQPVRPRDQRLTPALGLGAHLVGVIAVDKLPSGGGMMHGSDASMFRTRQTSGERSCVSQPRSARDRRTPAGNFQIQRAPSEGPFKSGSGSLCGERDGNNGSRERCGRFRHGRRRPRRSGQPSGVWVLDEVSSQALRRDVCTRSNRQCLKRTPRREPGGSPNPV